MNCATAPAMRDSFRDRFGSAENLRVFRAPGRVNLIGEHTDYNLGFVLPVALDLAASVGTAPGADGVLRVFSEQRGEERWWNIDDLAGAQPVHDWTDYFIGVAVELLRAGYPLAPANLYIQSTVPEGSGLSSSAALEVSCALALFGGRPIERLELARLCQRAERNFVGMPCGIMDQYISIFGRANSAVEIDCRSLEHRLAPLPAGLAFVAVNTMVKHALASSAYKDRVAECAAAVDAVRVRFPEVATLRDVSLEQLESVALPEVVRRRARHVITENERLHLFVDAGKPEPMGKLMVESHSSLRDDYEVSCAELDFLVETALQIEGVYGSRMTGGGFGGCTVTMLRSGAVERFREEIADAYRTKFDFGTPQIFECHPSDGAGEIK